MLIVLLALAALVLFGIRFTPRGIRPDYIGIPSSASIKGIFVIWVFFRHYKGFVSLQGPLDQPFLTLDRWLGQLIVAMFLFYSGYGIYESFQKKGRDYLRTIPKKRFLATLLHFDIAVLLYMLANLALGIHYSWQHNLLALTGWYSIGNSNWFIWVILMLYLVTWAALKLIPSKPWQVAAVTAVSILYAVVYYHYYPDYWWWCDTVYCYAAGMGYSLCRQKIEAFLAKGTHYWAALVLLAAADGILFINRSSMVAYEILAVTFSLTVVLISMKVTIGNRVLRWFGGQVFTVYILQRLVMTLLSEAGLSAYPYLFLVVSLGLTLGAAALFNRLLGLFDQKVLKIGR